MCTRLVKLTNFNLDSMESYQQRKEKMDTYIAVKKYLNIINERNKKEDELPKRPKWSVKRPECPKQMFLSEKRKIVNNITNKKETDSYYDFMDVNDITKVEDVNRLTELTIASYDYYKKYNENINKKSEVNHNTPNLRLYNKYHGKLVDFKKMDNIDHNEKDKKYEKLFFFFFYNYKHFFKKIFF